MRDERKHLRIGRLDVTLKPCVLGDGELAPCLDVFEDFCVVTESVRAGIDVDVKVQVSRSPRDAAEPILNAASGETA